MCVVADPVCCVVDCGFRRGVRVTSSGSYLYLRFTSDYSGTSSGFTAVMNAVSLNASSRYLHDTCSAVALADDCNIVGVLCDCRPLPTVLIGAVVGAFVVVVIVVLLIVRRRRARASTPRPVAFRAMRGEHHHRMPVLDERVLLASRKVETK